MSNWFWIGPTLAAIVTFLGIVWFKYQQGEFNPSLSLSYYHTRVAISPSQTLLFLEVEALNSSKVPVEVRYMETTLRRLSRYTDEEVGELYSHSLSADASPFRAIVWEQIFRIFRRWEERACTVQPGERHYETFEFIIPSSYDSIPIQVDIQYVNKPLEDDLTFNELGTAWRRIGVIAPEEREESE